ncbi:hypothetical protein V6N13_113610 [Hibiscus sabdariffa]
MEAKQCPWGFSRIGSKLGSIFNLDFKWISKEEAGNFKSSLFVGRDAGGGVESCRDESPGLIDFSFDAFQTALGFGYRGSSEAVV